MKMAEIAKKVGVSVATVSKVLNGKDEHISEKTRREILKCVEDNNYIPNAIAKGLKLNRTKMISYILPDIMNPFFTGIAKGIEDEARKRGYTVIVRNTDDDENAERVAVQSSLAHRVDGIILTIANDSTAFKEYGNIGVPVVFVGRQLAEFDDNCGRVYTQGEKIGYDSTKTLISAGCKEIAIITAYTGENNRRYEGYHKAITEANLYTDDSMTYFNKYNFETGYNGAKDICSKKKVDGIVCGNDLVAAGVLSYFHENGIRVPEDIKVIGVDDIYLAGCLQPNLTTVRQPTYELGVEAAKMIIDNIEYNVPLYKKVLGHQVILRDTV